MAKIIKNTTGSPVVIQDIGVTVAASSSYTSSPGDWASMANSANLVTLINAGTLVINDGIDDLGIAASIKHIQEESINRDSAMDMAETVNTLANSTLSLTANSNPLQVFTGNTLGQIIKLPDARTLTKGKCFVIQNEGAAGYPITINKNDNTFEITLNSQYRVIYFLQDNTTQGGIWLRAPESTAALSGTTPILCSYNGNANVGRYLEIFPSIDSNTIPFLIVVPQRLVALSFSASASSTATVGVFRSTDLVNPIASISLAAQVTNSDITLNVSVNTGDKLELRVTSGSVNKPAVAMYLST